MHQRVVVRFPSRRVRQQKRRNEGWKGTACACGEPVVLEEGVGWESSRCRTVGTCVLVRSSVDAVANKLFISLRWTVFHIREREREDSLPSAVYKHLQAPVKPCGTVCESQRIHIIFIESVLCFRYRRKSRHTLPQKPNRIQLQCSPPNRCRRYFHW
ncbi:hypothetical protein ARMGADRAFT_674046 [Armillaria gallica]|uniref:Uncharacterized protein n=1 Tax=Armillaria gallica TaxID=47427 RepID=A0A2H3D3E0_ARMGA|nr:hypothetical protein ARMGADRAFT_674046 [Armillaria gallica]